MAEIIFNSERLYTRQLTNDDLSSIKEQLQDPEVMYAYEGAFSDLMVKSWLLKQMERYTQDGCGLYALLTKDNDTFVGQCGVTMQEFEGRLVHEVGYLLSKRFWHEGYATEAAAAARDYAFEVLNAPFVCAQVRDNNIPSQKVAQRIGFKQVGEIVKHYRGFVLPHIVYGMTRADYLAYKAQVTASA